MHASEARRLASLNDKFNSKTFEAEVRRVVDKAFGKIRREANIGKRECVIAIPRKSLQPDKMASRLRSLLSEKNYTVMVQSSSSTRTAYDIRITW